MPEFVRDYWVDWQAANQQREDEARTVAKQMPEFDLYAGICKLADSEWECPARAQFPAKQVRKMHDSLVPPCPICSGTVRIVPFASLRVEKQGVWSHRDCLGLEHCDMVLTDGSLVRGTTNCQGRGWIPEPDVEKACWRAMTELMQDKVFDDAFGAWATEVETAEEAVIRAALAWLKEQHEP